MGEIKSTLDLVMERTRHLKMSEEEKVRQQTADFEKRLQGLLQQYADDTVSAIGLRDRIADLQAKMCVTDQQVLVKAVFTRIDPDQDNQRWLDLLENYAPAIRDPLQNTLEAHHKQKADLFQASKRRGMDNLARRCIEGSAVVPNPRKDTQYQESLAALRRETQAKIDAISQRTL